MLPTLQTPRLLLRALTLDDAAACVRICGQRIVAATTLRIPHPYSLADATAWLGTHPGLIAADKAAVFGITLDSTLIGTIGLTIDRPHARAELGYVIEPAHWGQGYATEAARAVVEHGLGPLALNRVFAWHVTRNPASGRVLAKAGLVHEGTQRRQFLKWGRFENAELFGIVRSASHAEPHAAPQLKPARFGEPAASPPPGPPSRRPIGSAPARRGDACNLRPLAPADRAIARAALAAPGIRAAALPWPGLPPAGHIDEIAEAYRRADEGLLIAIDDARGAHVGLAALRIDRAHERADFACLAAPGNPDPTHHAAPPLIDIAFQDLGLKRLTASATSPDAARTLEAVGFRHEATLKSHARIDGEYRDVRAFGLLREESAAIPQQS